MKYGDNILTIPLEIIFTDFVDNILRDNKTINQSFIENENVEEEKTGNTGLVVLFLSLILIVLIGLIYFILKKKNKNSDDFFKIK